MKRLFFLLLFVCFLLTAVLLVSCKEEEETYSPTYQIEYNCNGGTIPAGTASAYTAEKVVTFPTPTREGYTFLGWYSKADFSVGPITDTTNKSGNLTLYAKWRQNVLTVSFYINGQKIDALTQQVNFGSDASLPDLSAIAEYIPEGKAFAGWQGGYTDITEDTALSAILIDDNTGDNPGQGGDDVDPPVSSTTHALILNANGGVLSSPPTKYTEGEALTLPIPTRTGSNFAGWYTTQDFSGDPIENTEGCATDLVLYAKWEPITFRVTFQFTNPITGETEQIGDVQSVPYGGNAVLPDPSSFIPKGYQFIGWNRDHKNITSDRVIAAMIMVDDRDESWSPPLN